MPKRGDREHDESLPRWGDAEDATTLPGRAAPPARGGRLIEDDRPTELFRNASKASLHTSREQVIIGSTIGEMMRNPSHKLSRPLCQLVAQAKADLPNAEIDPRSSLVLRHEFEFDRRVGYQLSLKLFGVDEGCVEVSAEVDHDGRKIRRGSMMSKLIQI